MQITSHKLSKVPTIRRLPAYLRLLRHLQTQGWESVSGTYLAEQLQLESIQVRKDLAVTGIMGKPRVGFSVSGLIDAIEEFLGWDNATEAFLIGAGHLGIALMGYSGFQRHGLDIVAAFDVDPGKIGREVHGKSIMPVEKLSDLAQRLKVRIGILTVPAEAAQQMANLLVEAGITAIWNFTPVALTVPKHVAVQNEDLSAGLAVLSMQVRKSRQTRQDEDAAAQA